MSSFKYNIPFELDSPERTIYHRSLIKEKKFLKRLYEEWYAIFTKEIKGLPEGKLLELGSGGGFFKEICPEVICSDILELPSNDMCFSALDMPFSENELSGIFMIDTFHHIPDAEQFLKEVNRVLKPGGKLVMVEPMNSFFGRFIYRNFHHEPFDPKGNWQIPSSGPLSGANGALPWIVFKRDIALFRAKFPNLALQGFKPHTPFRYLLSGGVSFKQIVPDFSFGFIKAFENFLLFFSKQISMFVTIEVVKSSKN